jgi:hypothetical protein
MICDARPGSQNDAYDGHVAGHGGLRVKPRQTYNAMNIGIPHSASLVSMQTYPQARGIQFHLLCIDTS